MDRNLLGGPLKTPPGLNRIKQERMTDNALNETHRSNRRKQSKTLLIN